MFWKFVVLKANSRRKNTDFIERIAVKGKRSQCYLAVILLSCCHGYKRGEVTSLYWARFRVRPKFAGVSSDIEF